MKKFWIALLLLLVLIAAVGFSRGWFVLSSPGRDAGDSKRGVNLAVDPDQVREDIEAVKETAGQRTGGDQDDVEGPAPEEVGASAGGEQAEGRETSR